MIKYALDMSHSSQRSMTEKCLYDAINITFVWKPFGGKKFRRKFEETSEEF